MYLEVRGLELAVSQNKYVTLKYRKFLRQKMKDNAASFTNLTTERCIVVIFVTISNILITLLMVQFRIPTDQTW